MRKLRLNEREWPVQGLKDKVSNRVTPELEAGCQECVRSAPESSERGRGKDEGSREPSLYNLV